jgi:hypothetical protein
MEKHIILQIDVTQLHVEKVVKMDVGKRAMFKYRHDTDIGVANTELFDCGGFA